MQPTLDTNVMHEIVRQHEQRLRSDADRHALAHTAVAHTVPAPATHHRRARHRIATALRHLAERIEPARFETRPAAR
jgi:hypothetical protein